MTAGSVHRLAVVGYASLDSTVRSPRFQGLDATSIVGPKLADGNAGGIVHITSAIHLAGAEADAVSWVGADENGDRWRAALRSHGASDAGVAVSGSRTPTSTLIHFEAGGTICLFDPGDCHGSELTAAQAAILVAADWCLLTVAPRHIVEQVLDILPDTTRLAWAVKSDASAFPPELVERLLRRSALVSFSSGEAPFLSDGGARPEARVRPGTLLVETRGARGVDYAVVGDPALAGSVEVVPVAAADATGAGDTFIGTLTALLAAERPAGALTAQQLHQHLVASTEASAAMLERRHRTPLSITKETP